MAADTSPGVDPHTGPRMGTREPPCASSEGARCRCTGEGAAEEAAEPAWTWISEATDDLSNQKMRGGFCGDKAV